MTDLTNFLAELASDEPTPGGGSVAALSGALGASLTAMVSNLTIGKKKYADVEADMKSALETAESLRLELTRLIEEDANAFDGFMEALKLPKDTDEQKAKRKAAMQQGLVDAASVPLVVMEKCVRVIDVAAVAAEKGNRNAVSDAGVAALVARAGAHAAKLNVLINLGGITAEEHAEFVSEARTALENLTSEADSKADAVMRTVLEKVA
ncbi:MAG: methenyltetrahydrofolate cyclohydrolase [Candidatus Eisenbacteria bacterium]|nr:methenyltetrahydrofolate cyclohydrolase [Candidatus Eisenbacteria bacterium]